MIEIQDDVFAVIKITCLDDTIEIKIPYILLQMNLLAEV